MKKHYRHENDCLNCGAELQGKFCHKCGQENLQIKESFGHMMNHAISDYFHFDHQFFHTLKPLLFSPGKLTNEYMAGKRVQYLHPVKMYIFISLVYFVLLFSGSEQTKVNKDKNEDKKELVAANKKLDSLSKAPGTSGLEKDILATTKKHVDTAIQKADTTDTENAAIKKPKKHHFHLFGDDSDNRDTTYEQYLVTQQKLPPAKQDNFIRRYLRKREFKINENETDYRKTVVEGLKHNTPKMMFFLLPLFALLLVITFRKNKKYYVEHLIYSFHLHCFLFLFLTIIMLLLMVIPPDWHTVRDIVYWFATLSIIWYIFRSLRVVYHRTTGRTITKMIGLTFSYGFIFSICMLLLVIIVAVFD